MIRIPELKELHDSKFDVETIIRFYDDTVVEIEDDTNHTSTYELVSSDNLKYKFKIIELLQNLFKTNYSV